MDPAQLVTGLLQYAVLLFSLVFHEFGHAWTALRCGDPTAKRLGRVTLNPLAHADLVGTLILPLVQIFTHVPLIGWAKPVPFNPANLRHPRRDDMLIAVAGPGFNIILALAASFVLRLVIMAAPLAGEGHAGTLVELLFRVLPWFMQINVMLAVFNLIPVPPLDGSWILYHLLPRELAYRYRVFGARWGVLLLLALVYTSASRIFLTFGYSILAPVLRAVAGL